MATRRLIVNADDFGLTTGVNRAVLDGHTHGIITSATLMANGAAFASAVEMARRAPRLGVGVHVNLLQGAPVSAPDRVGSLVDGGGRFNRTATDLALALLMGKVDRRELEVEVRAQIERVVESGVRVTHIDGHKHAHLIPSVFEIVTRLAREYGIRAVRCARESRPHLLLSIREAGPSASKVAAQWLVGRGLSALARWNVRRLGRDLATPPRIIGVTQTGFLTAEIVQRLLESLGEEVTELMCHPGYVDKELDAVTTRLRASREQELAALTDAAICEYIDREGIELITYEELTLEP